MKKHRIAKSFFASCSIAGLALFHFPGISNASHSDPAGYVNRDLPATGYAYVGVSLVTSWAVKAPVSSLSGANVTVNGSNFGANLKSDHAYFLEITSGEYEGSVVDIASWSGDTLTLVQDIEAAGIDAGKLVGSEACVRETPTINSVFGATNSAGLKAGTLSTADLVLLYNGSSYDKFYYFSGGFGQPAQWRNAAGTEAGSTAIPYGCGLIIQVRDSQPKSIKLYGNVKLGKTSIPVFEGYNLISNPNPIEAALTLSNSGLKDGLQAGTASTADIVHIPNASGGFDKFYFFSGGFGQPAAWKNVSTGANADDVALPDSGSFYIQRRSGDTTITLAATTVSD